MTTNTVTYTNCSRMTLIPNAAFPDAGNQVVTVAIPTGAIKDQAGLSSLPASSYQFTVPDVTPPTLTAYSPLQNAADVQSGSKITFTFSEPMVAGTGSSSEWMMGVQASSLMPGWRYHTCVNLDRMLTASLQAGPAGIVVYVSRVTAIAPAFV